MRHPPYRRFVDEDALVDCLRRRAIGGAALDVFSGIDVFARPGVPQHHPLLELDNVIATPHCAGSSVESTRKAKAEEPAQVKPRAPLGR